MASLRRDHSSLGYQQIPDKHRLGQPYSSPFSPFLLLLRPPTPRILLRKRRLRPRPIRNHPHHMPPLPVLEVRHSTMRRAPLIPHDDRPGLPPHTTAEVHAPDVPVQEIEHGVRLLGQETLDPPRDGRVHEECGLPRDGVPDDERVRRGHGLAEGALGADAGDLADGRRGVEEAEAVERVAVGRAQGGVGGREGGEGRVAAARGRGLEDPEEGGGGDVGREGLVDVPEVVGCALAEEGAQVASGRVSVCCISSDCGVGGTYAFSSA